MSTHSLGASKARTDIALWRRLLVSALGKASRWLDRRAYALEYPAEATLALDSEHLEVAEDPLTGYSALYVNGERRFTFLQGLERL